MNRNGGTVKTHNTSGKTRSTARFEAIIAVSFVTTAIEIRLPGTFCLS